MSESYYDHDYGMFDCEGHEDDGWVMAAIAGRLNSLIPSLDDPSDDNARRALLWPAARGPIALGDMASSHIHNTIKKIKREKWRMEWLNVLQIELDSRRTDGEDIMGCKKANPIEADTSRTGVFQGGVFKKDETERASDVIVDIKTVLATTEQSARDKLLIEASRGSDDFNSDDVIVVIRAF